MTKIEWITKEIIIIIIIIILIVIKQYIIYIDW